MIFQHVSVIIFMPCMVEFDEHSSVLHSFLVMLEGVCFTADIFWEDFVSNISYVTLNVILSQKPGLPKKRHTG